MQPSARRLFGKDSAVSSATANPAPALPAAEPSSNILKSSWQSLRPTPASEATPYSPPPELIPPPPSPTAGGVMMPDQTCAPTTQEVTPASGRKLPSVRMPHLRALFGG